MSCQKCNSGRVAHITAKCSDMFSFDMGKIELNDYVPKDIGIGGGDYVQLEYCLDCGQIQGDFPLPLTNLEENLNDTIDDEECAFCDGIGTVEGGKYLESVCEYCLGTGIKPQKDTEYEDE